MATLQPPDSAVAVMLPTGSATHNTPDSAPTLETPAFIAGLRLLETAGLAEACRDATAKLARDNHLGKNWVPVLGTLQDVENGQYRIQFTNFDNPEQVHVATTEDPVFKEFKANLDVHFRSINQSFKFENGQFTPKEAVTDAEAVDGVNAMNLVKKIIDLCTGPSSTPDDTNFGKAVEIQGWVNLAQYVRQGAKDLGELANIYRTLRGSKALGPRLSSAVKGLGHVSAGADVALSVVNVGFDFYELANAPDETNRAVYGTQAAFDSVSLVVNTAGVAAGYLGASSAAAVLGGVGVILGGLAIGFEALARAFGHVTQCAQGVGEYFGKVEEAYKKGGYTYNEKDKSLEHLRGAVITELNMMTGKVQFGTQYIYRSRHKKFSLGSGKINMITVMPDMDTNQEDALNVREGIGAPSFGTLPNYADCKAITLPATPQSYIAYFWMNLPGCTSRHDYGFDVIRRLEEKETFDYDFYTFPSEWTIVSTWHVYDKDTVPPVPLGSVKPKIVTPITVYLPNRPVFVQVPPLPQEQYNLLHYTVHGAGKQYTVALNPGVQITLTSTHKDTCWVFDALNVSSDKFKVEDKTVKWDDLSATITGQFSSVLIAGQRGEVFRVDLDTKNFFPIKEDAAKDEADDIIKRLEKLSPEDTNQGTFIVIENYTTDPKNTDPQDRKNFGRAFYDVAGKRVLFTANAPTGLMEDAQFVDAGEDGVYFYNIKRSSIWLVDPANGGCKAKYHSFSQGSLKRVWREDTSVFAAFGYDYQEGETTYVLRPDSMSVISTIATSDMLERLDGMVEWSAPLKYLVGGLSKADSPSPTDGADIRPDRNNTILSVFGQGGNGRKYRFWLRPKKNVPERTIIKANFPPPDDLVLAGTITPPGANVEEFYFYSREQGSIHMQTGTGRQTGSSDAKEVKVPPEFGELSNVINDHGPMFALTNLGYTFRISSQGTLTLFAVTQQWFKQFETGQHGPWWNVLKQKVNSDGATAVAILGLQDNNGNNVPAWIYAGTIVIASPTLSGKPLEVAGLDGGGGAWLRSTIQVETKEVKPEKMKTVDHLYNQPLVRKEQLADVLSPTTTAVIADKIPPGVEVLKDLSLKKTAMANSGVQCITTDGLILIVNVMNDKTVKTQLCGVNKSWQDSHRSDHETMEANLGKLSEQWKQREVIAMPGHKEEAKDVPAWYLVPAGRVVEVIDGDASWPKAVYLGTDITTDDVTGWFHLPSSGVIRHAGDWPNGPYKQPVIMAVRSGDSLMVVPKRRANFSLIALRNVRYFMLSQVDGGGAECTIPQASWQHYRATVIQWKNSGQINVKLDNAGALVARKDGDDLLIFDHSSDHFLMIRKAFGTDPAYTMVTVKFTSLDFSISAAVIQSTQAWLDVNADPASPPDVTLETIGRHLKNPELDPHSFAPGLNLETPWLYRAM